MDVPVRCKWRYYCSGYRNPYTRGNHDSDFQTKVVSRSKNKVTACGFDLHLSLIMFKKLVGHANAKLIALIIVGAIIILGGCQTSKNDEGFAIYLTKEDIPPAQMEALSYVEIADQPIISLENIIAYNAQTHELRLTDIAFERISQLEVPVGGKSFLVCVDKGPIYWGAFWTPISSISFDGITIWKPLNSQKLKVITLELGYPSPSFYRGKDPRDNDEVMKSLEQAGKLINKSKL